ncbi:MAG: hypothetical protein DIZ77_01970 [endosymbiont of Seepiophila jonesi]|uniref:DNA 3'-5' helicase n=1 Tax=endosymbiont of Lamellibrachia luymesi TaxID=2200907 RepID=A0A370DXB3_9GAMM|nr:MAG: hypothetical protein DIZ79_10305 [endosymbiont of Lamellibrachia luymesi]RDH94283.1 MAG: hypothetical protein DIZ77_01970 [endosymbiont of Seepiophila jonesi]
MRVLSNIDPTDEQLKLASITRLGIEVIRGAAGSGKTTTALLRLRAMIATCRSRLERSGEVRPVRALVLTFNRTLRGYVQELAKQQAQTAPVDLQISTFAKWAKDSLSTALGARIEITNNGVDRRKIAQLGVGLPLPPEYLIEEVEYAMSRFMPGDLEAYLEIERTGRGISPRVDRGLREILIQNVMRPYQDWIDKKNLWNWNDLAVSMASKLRDRPYDIIVVDEAQDFSANQLRAIRCHLAKDHFVTFVLDTTQRIYARGYTWTEAGFSVRPENVHRLKDNFRNTRQIARFAAGMLSDLPADADASLPNEASCRRDGPLPAVLVGRFKRQLDWTLDYIEEDVDLAEQSVAFLHPKGGGWFDAVRHGLTERSMAFEEISKRSEWPSGKENIALSTLHSAKGLEFDHVVIIGLDRDITDRDYGEDDDRMVTLRRLLAMAIGRAKHSVILGYKPESASRLVEYLDEDSFKEIEL